jgi:hypothetical protein
MAKFVSDLDINQNQIKNGRFESLASDPSTGNFEGRLFYNSTEKVIKWRTDAGVRKALHAVTSSTTALTSSESNGSISLTIADATGSVSGLLSAANFTLLTGATSANTASAIVRRDASGDFAARNITAAVVTGLSTPVNGSDAATKGYVDGAVQGLDIKASVRCTTTANITLSGAQTIDGVAVGAGERVLVKNQSTASENGIYDSASGAWARSFDAQDGEISPGMFVFVEMGTVNADSGWVLTTNSPMLPIGQQALTFAQFSGAGQIAAGAGLTKTGNTVDAVGTADRITVNADSIDIASTYVGQTSIVTLGTVTTGTWNATTIAANRGGTGQTSYTVGDLLYADSSSTLAKLADVATGNALLSGGVGVAPSWGKIGLTTHVSGTLPIANGGTNASTVAAARTNLDVPRKYKSVVPNANPATITHSLGTTDVMVQIYEIATGITVYADVTRTSANAVSVGFSVTPSANQYQAIIIAVE